MFCDYFKERIEKQEFAHPLYNDIKFIEKCQEIAQSDWIGIDTALGKRFVSAHTFYTYRTVDNGCHYRHRGRYELIPNCRCAALDYVDDVKVPLFHIKICIDGSGLVIISDKMSTKECLLAIKEALSLVDKAAENINTVREQAEQDKKIKQFIQERIVNDFYNIGGK